MGNIRLYGSTSGYTELAPPAVAPDGVLSLPSGVGTLLTAEGGKVLQVVRATDATSRTTTSTSFVDASISVTITPQRSTSVVLLVWSATGTHVGTSDFALFQITDSSDNSISGAERQDLGSNTTNTIVAPLLVIGYETPATTSPVTYKGRFAVSSTGTAQLNNNVKTGQMYAIEVSA
jgi:hypothetical protein